ncbi:MAG: CPBP family intramembrane metalloprotease [Chloroflexi bacterium]|nr:CPBP family intramembrane metalloprotease [Chloroflexota bacterium]
MNRTVEWVRQHQVRAFFLLTFGITWASWILGFVLFPEDELLQAPFVKVGIFAPALVSILISSVVNRELGKVSVLTRWVIFGTIWLVAWLHLVLYANVVSDLTVNPKLIVVGGIITTLPAFVISSAFSRNEGIRSHLASIIRPGGNPVWNLFAILIIPVTMALGAAISLALGDSLPAPDHSIQDPVRLQTLGMIVLVFLNELVQAGGLPEEPGWRGFALPRLQTRFSPLAASIILGLVWALWHGPLLIGMLQEAGPCRMVLRILMIGITFTWLYNRTRGSLLAVVLLHASWNTALAFLPRTDAFLFLMAGLLIVLVVADRMWEKLSTDSAALYRATEGAA